MKKGELSSLDYARDQLADEVYRIAERRNFLRSQLTADKAMLVVLTERVPRVEAALADVQKQLDLKKARYSREYGDKQKVDRLREVARIRDELKRLEREIERNG